MNQPRFFRARDHLRANTRLTDNGVQEFAAIFRFPDRARCSGDDLIDMV